MQTTDKVAYDSRMYTNIQGLKQLQGEKNSEGAKKEVAQQFEALMMQMVFHSMREANQTFSSGLFGSDQMDLYQDMFDKQLSLLMSNSSLGFAKMVEKNLDQMTIPHAAANESIPLSVTEITNPQTKLVEEENFSSEEDFVKKLYPFAKMAGNTLGVQPGVLLAQAALETNWGKNIIQKDKNNSSNNLFNIKSENNDEHAVIVSTLEQKNGVLTKEKAGFRTYSSLADSFNDYVSLLQQNSRYSEALQQAKDPKKFVQGLQKAGYATDENYANKIMKIYGNPSFQTVIEKMR